jgi:putative MATE family efflux protein
VTGPGGDGPDEPLPDDESEPSTDGGMTPDDAPEEGITSGSLARPMLRLAWPIVVIQLLQVAYNLADTIWLGRYDVGAVGAISLAFPLVFLLISVAGGFTTAGSILVAQYTGAESEGSAGKVAGQTLSFVSLLGMGLGVFGFFVTRDLLALLPTQQETAQEIVPLAAGYMEVILLGAPFMFGFFIFSALMRGYGDTKTPMRVMIVSVVLNVVIDPIMIFGVGPVPELGIQGAALATVFSRGVATAIGLHYLFRTDAGPDVKLSHLYLDPDTVKQIVSLGVPSALEQSASALAMVTLSVMVFQFGPPVVAAYGLGNRLISLVFLPAMGLGRATNTMVGQNLGAKKPDRAQRAAFFAAGTGAGVMLVVAVVAFLFPEPIVRVFVDPSLPDAQATIKNSTNYVRIRTVEFAFIGILQPLLGAFRGAGNTRTAMAFSMLALWVGRVPTVAYLAFGTLVLGPLTIVGLDLGARGIWIGMALGNTVGAIVATLWFMRGTWKEAVIDEEEPGSVAGPSED